MKLERKFYINPAYDYILNPTEERKGCGRHCCDMVLGVKGDKGGVSYEMTTGWYLKETEKELGSKLFGNRYGKLIIHHKKENDDTVSYRCNCDYTDGECYFEITGLRDDLLAILISKGSESLYEELEKIYHNRFET